MFVKEWKEKGEEIKSPEELLEYEGHVWIESSVLLGETNLVVKTIEAAKIVYEHWTNSGNKLYKINVIKRTPIISEDIDEELFSMIDNVIDRYHDDYEHLTENNINEFLKELVSKYEIKKKGN